MVRYFRPLAVTAAVVALMVIMIGGYTSATGSGMGCGEDWPHCNGTLRPDTSIRETLIEWSHRLGAIALGSVGLTLLGYTIANRHAIPRIAQGGVYLAAGLFASQALLGMAVVKTLLKAELVALHAGVAASLFASLVVAILFGPRFRDGKPAFGGLAATGSVLALAVATKTEATDGGEAPTGRRSFRETVKDYTELVKPGILTLLLVVGAAAMLIAPGNVTWQIAVGVLVGGGLAACAAAVFNNVYEKDKDAMMARTKRRPVASGRVTVGQGLVFAGVLTAASVAVLFTFVNWTAAAFTLAGLLFYVIVYTMWLKPYTPQNIVIGGAAGCAPAFVGWAAVTNDVSLAPVILGLLVFLWTPPHFWALALVYKEDYAKAAFPMHPVIKGGDSTRRQILGYSVLTLLASLVLVWPLGVLGWLYAVSAVALGGLFVGYAWQLLLNKEARTAYRLFWYSIVYLGLLYGAMVVDRIVVRVLA